MVKYGNRERFPVQLWHVTGEHINALPDVSPWRSRAFAPQRREVVSMEKPERVDAVEMAREMREGGASWSQIAEATGLSRSSVRRLFD